MCARKVGHIEPDFRAFFADPCQQLPVQAHTGLSDEGGGQRRAAGFGRHRIGRGNQAIDGDIRQRLRIKNAILRSQRGCQQQKKNDQDEEKGERLMCGAPFTDRKQDSLVSS